MWWHNEKHTWGRGSRQYQLVFSIEPKTSWWCNECRRRYECLLTVKRDFCEFWMPPKLNSMNGAWFDWRDGRDYCYYYVYHSSGNVYQISLMLLDMTTPPTSRTHDMISIRRASSRSRQLNDGSMIDSLSHKRGWRRPIDHASILVECTAVPVGRRLFCVWRDERVYSPWLTEEYEKHTVYVCACGGERERW